MEARRQTGRWPARGRMQRQKFTVEYKAQALKLLLYQANKGEIFLSAKSRYSCRLRQIAWLRRRSISALLYPRNLGKLTLAKRRMPSGLKAQDVKKTPENAEIS